MIVAIVVVFVAGVLWIQARRRRGGAIVDPAQSPRTRPRGMEAMSRLMRSVGELMKRPVVTMGGEDVAQVKDIVYSAGGGAVGGFTLAGRGLMSGPLKQALAWSSVMALGPDAVMIRDEGVLEPKANVLDRSTVTGNSGGDVLGSRCSPTTGTELGTVLDVVLEVAERGAGQCDVVPWAGPS